MSSRALLEEMALLSNTGLDEIICRCFIICRSRGCRIPSFSFLESLLLSSSAWNDYICTVNTPCSHASKYYSYSII